jgi:bacteriorhodopsin
MDWLLTVPLLLIEIIFCCNLSPDEVAKKAWALGGAAGLMIILGYPGELILEGPALGVRFLFWVAAMVPFAYVVHTLLVGLKEAIASEGNPKVATMLTQVCYATVVRVRVRIRIRVRVRVSY